jgi:hypothetical protein
MDLKSKFAEVYRERKFGGRESRSGPGSDLTQTTRIRFEIPRLIREFGLKSMLDAPCGDWFWMRRTELGIEKYIGADIVEELIEKNQYEFGREGVEFFCLDLSCDPLPKTDLIFSRDCLVHLSYEDAFNMLANFKRSGAKYILMTTFSDRYRNEDLGSLFWRPLNMQHPPFGFPPPVALINEGCTEAGNFADKSLGLWALNDWEQGQNSSGQFGS